MADNKAIAYLSVNNDEVKAKLEETRKQFSSLGNGIKSTADSILNLGRTVVAFELITNAIEKLKASFDFADSLNDISAQFGIAVSELSQLEGLAKLNGASFETLQKGYMKLSEAVSDAGAGSEEAVAKFKELGISVKDAEGNLKSTSQVFEELADVFKNSNTDANKMATALDLLGKSGRELIPLLNQGSDGIKQIKQELNNLGLVIQDSVAISIGTLGDTLDKLALKSKSTFSNLAAVVSPAFSALGELYLKEFKLNLSDEEFKKKLFEAQDLVFNFIESVLTTIDKLSPSFTAIFETISSLMSSLFETAKETFGNIMQIFGLTSESGETDFKKINDIITTTMVVFKTLVEVIGAVAQAIIEIIATMAKSVTTTLSGLAESVGYFGRALNDIKNGEFKDSAISILNSIATVGKTGNSVLKDSFNGVGSTLVQAGSKIKNSFDGIDKYITELGNKQVKNQTSLAGKLKDIYGKTVDSIRNPQENKTVGSIARPDKSKGGETAKAQLEYELKIQEYFIQQENEIYANRNKVLEIYRQKDVVNADDYIEARKNSDELLYKNTMEALEKEKTLLESAISKGGKDKDIIKNREKLEEVTKKISKTSQDYYQKEFENSIKFQDEKDKDEKKLNNVLKRIYELQGQDGSIIDIELKTKLDDLKKLENIIGKDNVEKASQLEISFSNLNKVKKDLDDYKNHVSIAEDEINIKREAGYLSELESLSKIRDIRSENIEQLKQYKSDLEKLAQLNPDNKKLQDDIKKTGNEILKLETTLDPLAKKFDDIFSDGFSTFFSDVLSGTKSVKDAFEDMSKSILNSINKLMMDDLSKQFYSLLTGGSGGSTGGLGSLFSSMFNSSSKGSSSSNGIGSMLGSIGSSLSGFGSSIMSFLGFADGGIPPINKASIVGENGPELFIPGVTGTILNNDVSSRMMSGSSTVINVNIQTQNLESFRNSEGQIGATINSALNKARRNQ